MVGHGTWDTWPLIIKREVRYHERMDLGPRIEEALLGAEMTPLPIGPRLQFAAVSGTVPALRCLWAQPKLHVESLIDLPLARESSSNGYVWVRKRARGQQLSAWVWG